MQTLELPDEADVEELAAIVAMLMTDYQVEHEDALIVFFMAGMILLLNESKKAIH
jgi:hypothetical protein